MRPKSPIGQFSIDAFANEPTRLATSEFVDRVRTSGAALTLGPRRNVWASVEGARTSATSASETSLKESGFLEIQRIEGMREPRFDRQSTKVFNGL